MSTLYVAYNQIAVFPKDLESPFNQWTEKHIRQGFTWRRNSVSFSALVNDADYDVSVEIMATDRQIGTKNPLRIIRVPFEVERDTLMEISTVLEETHARIPQGKYALYYEAGLADSEYYWIQLSFVGAPPFHAEILLRDGELEPGDELLMSAKPA